MEETPIQKLIEEKVTNGLGYKAPIREDSEGGNAYHNLDLQIHLCFMDAKTEEDVWKKGGLWVEFYRLRKSKELGEKPTFHEYSSGTYHDKIPMPPTPPPGGL